MNPKGELSRPHYFLLADNPPRIINTWSAQRLSLSAIDGLPTTRQTANPISPNAGFRIHSIDDQKFCWHFCQLESQLLFDRRESTPLPCSWTRSPLNQNVMAAKIRPPPFMSGPAVHHGVAFGDRLVQLSVKPELLSIGDVGKHHPAVKSLGGWILTKAGGRRTATKSRLMQTTLP